MNSCTVCQACLYLMPKCIGWRRLHPATTFCHAKEVSSYYLPYGKIQRGDRRDSALPPREPYSLDEVTCSYSTNPGIISQHQGFSHNVKKRKEKGC